MLLELAKPISFLLCLYSLLTVFHRAFFTPGESLVENGADALQLLLFAGGISAVSGILFLENDRAPGSHGKSAHDAIREARRFELYPSMYRGLHIVSRREVSTRDSLRFRLRLEGILKTLPVQVFLWGTGLMVGLFLAAWYMETYFLPYRHARW